MSTVIVNTVNRKLFFTSTSSYDQPKWVPIAEATKYITPDLADRAMKKLISNGVYTVGLQSLAEAMSFEMPDVAPKKNPQGNIDVPIDGQDENNDEEMVADDQEEVCPECDHEPCTCEVSDDLGDDDLGDDDLGDDDLGDDDLGDDDLGDDDLGDDDLGDDLPPKPISTRRSYGDVKEGVESSVVHPYKKGQKVQYEGKIHTIINDSGVGIAVISSDDDPLVKHRVLYKDITPVTEDGGISTIVQRIVFSNPSTNGEFDQGGDPDDTKVTVPDNVKSALSDTIDKFNKAANSQKNVNDDDASFSMTVAGALTDLQNSLNMGTVGGIKKAQITLTSLMSPISSNIPDVVLKFIHLGGKKPSLKDLFDDKRQAVVELSDEFTKQYQLKAIADVVSRHKAGDDGVKTTRRARTVAGTIQKTKDKKSGIDTTRRKYLPFRHVVANVKENVDPEGTYDVRAQQINQLLDEIKQELSNHRQEFSQDTDSWAHPGDLAHVEEQLREILAFIKGEEAAE